MQASVLCATTSSRSQWPAAVSPLVAALVTGPVQLGRVLGVFPTCVYVGLGPHDHVVALLAHDAVALPIGVRLAVDSCAIQWGVSPGDVVEVGSGRVRLPAGDIVAARFQPPSHSRVLTSCRHLHTRVLTSCQVPDGRKCTLDVGGELNSCQHPHTRVLTSCQVPDGRKCTLDVEGVLTSCQVADGRKCTLDVRGALGERARALAAAALAGLPVRGLLSTMVGAGPGLTPSGDDAICGVLLTLRAAGAVPALEAVVAELRSLHHATTSISAALLSAAADGYAAPEVVALVDLLFQASEPTDRHDLDQPPSPSTTAAARAASWRSAGPRSLDTPSAGPRSLDTPSAGPRSLDTSSLDEALQRVCAIGHTSGQDLVAGIAGAQQALFDISASAANRQEAVHA